jgi:CheY-like chemotaxis protein
MKVILFDDELSAHAANYRMAGIELICLPHADDALAVVARERPDVVLMDFTMYSERSGADAVSELSALRQRQQLGLRIVGISAEAAANQRMLRQGADDAIPKTHIRGYLHKLLEQQRPGIVDTQR